ncbi:hypothetical protein [Natrinema halophilum]|uniref:hypothetical protein n=1 Tax=Natrinema halophilum TaxID=1699371 RepID=UPI001F34576E|nr:hypothetical protein [Natrinema halophilum]UHQ96001.1 hypothetical protein HYG82_16645 [Natrinema halophilum]
MTDDSTRPEPEQKSDSSSTSQDGTDAESTRSSRTSRDESRSEKSGDPSRSSDGADDRTDETDTVARSPDASPSARPDGDDRTDLVDPDGANRNSDGERDDGDDPSVGISLVHYVLRLTVAALTVGARIIWTGVRIAARYLTDTPSRRRARRWLLLEGDRRAIVVGFVAGIFGLALVLGISDVIGVRESRFVTTMFSTMIAGLFSFIPIVVAVNQLIISRLFGTPDRLTDRIDGVQEFRSRVESQTEGDGVSPTGPAPFLARLAGTLGTRADELATECGEGERNADSSERSRIGDEEADDTPISALESICRFAARTREHTNDLSSQLTGKTDSVFAVVLPTIDHDYAGAANEARRLRRRFDEDLPDRAEELLSELRELFVTADATRQYFTTIYLQRELARLSRLITYSGTAAILLSSLVIMIYASGYPPVAFEGWLLVLVSLALAVAFSPLAVLFAYVVRISAILMRTSAPGAFTPPGEFHESHDAAAKNRSVTNGTTQSNESAAKNRSVTNGTTQSNESAAKNQPASTDEPTRSNDPDRKPSQSR